MNQRHFLATSMAATLATRLRAADGSPAKKITLWSSWQTVNIGDIAHWKIHHQPINEERDAVNNEFAEKDHAKLREAITAWVRETGMKVFSPRKCPTRSPFSSPSSSTASPMT